MRRLLLHFSISLAFAPLSAAQQQTVQYFVFSTDSVEMLDISLPDSMDVHFWPGNTVLVEQHIRLYHDSKPLFTHFLKKTDRYRIEGKRQGALLQVVAASPLRHPLKDKAGRPIAEEVHYVIYLPDPFEPFAANRWRKKRPAHPAQAN